MRFALQIAWSHLKGRRRTAGVSAIGMVSVIGVAVGVTALIMVLAVMEGFEVDLREKILGSNAHVVVLRYSSGIDDWEDAVEKVQAVDGVTGVAPFIYTEMMIKSEHGNGEGIILKGIDPDQTGDVTSLLDDLRWGPNGEITTDEERRRLFASMNAPIAPPADEEDGAPLPGIIIGKELMEQLQAHPGDTVQMINPLGGGAGPQLRVLHQPRRVVPRSLGQLFDRGPRHRRVLAEVHEESRSVRVVARIVDGAERCRVRNVAL